MAAKRPGLTQVLALMSKDSRTFRLLIATLLAISPLQSGAQSQATAKTDPVLEAITAAFEFSAKNGHDTKDQVIIAQRIRKYIVVSFIESCGWKGTCKDGRREVVYDPSLRKVVYALGAG